MKASRIKSTFAKENCENNPAIFEMVCERVADLNEDLKALTLRVTTGREDSDAHNERQCEQMSSLHTMLESQLRDHRLLAVEVETKLNRKAERSELQKSIHLSNLLAIECRQIQERFDAFTKEQTRLQMRCDELEQQSGRFQFESEDIHERKIRELEEKIKHCMEIFTSRQGTERSQEEMRVPLAANQFGNRKQEKISIVLENIFRNEERSSEAMRLAEKRLNELEEANLRLAHKISQIARLKTELGEMRAEYSYKNASELSVVMEERIKNECQNAFKSISKQLEVACEELMEKMDKLFEEGVRREEFIQHCTANHARWDSLFNFQIKVDDRFGDFDRKINKLHEEKRKQGDLIREIEGELLRVNRELTERPKSDEVKQIAAKQLPANEVKQLIKQAETRMVSMVKYQQTEQGVLNEALCSQNVVVRWLWTTGELCTNLVQWDKESVNTLPENFRYLPQECALLVLNSGIYRIEMGFYAKKKPTIQIIVNGRTVVSAVNSNSYVLHHSSGKLKDIGGSEIAGLTCVDYLCLSENSKIIISYVGDQAKQGFIGLKRL